MANEIDKLVIDVQFKSDQALKAIKELNKSIDGFSKDSIKSIDRVETEMTSSFSKIGSVFKTGLMGFGLVAGAKFAADFVSSATANGLNQQFLSRAFGVKTEKLQEFQQAFKLIGSSADAANQTVASLYQKLHSGMPQQEIGKSLSLFSRAGVNIPLLTKNKEIRDPLSILTDMLSNLDKLPKNQRQLAMNGFVDSMTGNAFIAGGFKNLLNEANKTGTISSATVDKLAQSQRGIIGTEKKAEILKTGTVSLSAPIVNIVTDRVNKVADVGNFLTDDKLSWKTKSKALALGAYDATIGDAWHAIKHALSGVETSFGKNLTDRKYTGNSQFRGYGEHQITKKAFEEVMGYTPSNNDLKNKQLLQEASAKYWQKGFRLSGGDIHGANAFYNGGAEGLSLYQGMPADNDRKRQKLSNINRYNSRFDNIANAQANHNYNNQNNSHTTNNHHVSYNVNASFPNVSEPHQFMADMHNMYLSASNSNGILA